MCYSAQIINMCDCRVVKDLKSGKKRSVCRAFFRVLKFDIMHNEMSIGGDFDHNGKPYKILGKVRPQAQCCSCCDESNGTKEVCYNISCFLRKNEKNNGVTAFEIFMPSGESGGVVEFNPPANSADQIAVYLNNIKYLGYDTWSGSDDEMLCVSVLSSAEIPKNMSGCRFKRYQYKKTDGLHATDLQKIQFVVYEYEEESKLGFEFCRDELAINYNIGRDTYSEIHYLCSVEGKNNGSNFILSPPIAQNLNPKNADLFRLSFNTDSSKLEVFDSISGQWVDKLGQNILIQNSPNLIAAALQDWLASRLLSIGINATVSISYSGNKTHKNNAIIYDLNCYIDTPCNVSINSMRSVAFQGRDNQGVYPQNIDPNNDKRPYSEVENDGTLKGAALTSSHIFLFEQDTAVGDFNVTPSIDGEGGFNGLTENCTEIEYV